MLYLKNQNRYRHAATTKLSAMYDFIFDFHTFIVAKINIFRVNAKKRDFTCFQAAILDFQGCSTPWISVDFGYVIQNFLGFQMVQVAFLLQFVLGYPFFQRKSPGLYPSLPWMNNKTWIDSLSFIRAQFEHRSLSLADAREIRFLPFFIYSLAD